MMWLSVTESALLASISPSVRWGCFELSELPGLCFLPLSRWGRATIQGQPKGLFQSPGPSLVGRPVGVS